MKDDLVRETLARAARGEPPAGDAWTRFQSRRRRSAIWRNASVASATVVAVVALVSTLPGLTPRGTPDLLGPGPGSPDVTATWNNYVDPIAQFQFRYPLDWVTQGESPGSGSGIDVYPRERLTHPFGHGDGPDYTEEGPLLIETRLEPRARIGTPSCEQLKEARAGGPDEFDDDEAGCSTSMTEGLSEQIERQRRAGASVREAVVKVDGRPALRFDLVFPRDPVEPAEGFRALGGLVWCPGCTATAFVIDWYDGWVLDVRLVSPSRAEFDRHGTVASKLLETLRRHSGRQLLFSKAGG